MDTCSAVGCFKPRHKSTGGYEYRYCYDHWLQRMESFKWEESQKEAKVMVKSDVCTVEGCGKSRMRNKQGEMLTMCEDHQREYWRKQAARKRPKASPAKKVQPVQRQADPLAIAVNNINQAVDSLGAAARRAFPDEAKKLEAILTVNPVEHDCDQCEAKAVIEALRAKSPKLAKLIDAMQAEVEAAAELGL